MRSKKDILEENEILYSTLSSIGDGVISADSNGCITFMNKKAEELTGWGSQDVMERSIYEVFIIVDGVNGSPYENLFAEVMKNRTSAGLRKNAQLISREGIGKFVSANISPVISREGSIKGTVTVFRDVSRFRYREEEMEHARNFYMELLENIPALVWMSGPNKELIYFNKAWMDYTGRTLEQEMGHGWIADVHPDDWDKYCYVYGSESKNHNPFEILCRLRRYDGEYRWFVNAGKPFYDVDGNFAGYIGFCHDTANKESINLYKDNEQTLINQLYIGG